MFAKLGYGQNASHGRSSGRVRRSLLAIATGMGIILMAIVLVLLQQGVHPVRANPDVTIDAFTTEQHMTQTGIGSTFSVSSTVGADIIGQEREITVTVTAFGTANTLNVDIIGGNMAHSQGSGVVGTTEVTWDGSADGGSAGIDPDGLGAQDLTEEGMNSALHLELVSADFSTRITVTVYTDFITQCSSLAVTAPGDWPSTNPPWSLLFPFAAFTTGSGCTSAADFTKVGAITLFIDGATPDTDITLKAFEAVPVDFGDLPSPTGAFPDYQITVFADNGAAHVINNNLKLGANIDKENDGQESANADGDDTAVTDDEDGVVPTPGFLWGTTITDVGSVDVTVTGPLSGCLSAWIDWSDDGDLTDSDVNGANENIIDYVPVVSGTTTFTFTTPANFPNHTGQAGYPNHDRTYFARFRLFPRKSGACAKGTATTSGFYVNQFPAGEVEDYLFEFGPNIVTLTRLKASSAPSRLPANAAAAALALLASSMVVGGVLVLRRRGRLP